MTGYGNSKMSSSDISIEVSIRTINGRFLETRMHVPREYMSYESELKKILSEKINRGTVDVFISRKAIRSSKNSKIKVNENLAREYMKAYQQMAKTLKQPLQIHVELLARQPDVIVVEENSEISKQEIQLLKKVFLKALSNCMNERVREGKALRKELLNLANGINKLVDQISEYREEANKYLQERLEQKMSQKMKGVELDPQRIAQEVVIQLEKSDINEELSRLNEHLKNYRDIISQENAEGKKLDFYTQELLREVNTIGSKSQVAIITQAVVETKTFIERLREQVQNVE